MLNNQMVLLAKITKTIWSSKQIFKNIFSDNVQLLPPELSQHHTGHKVVHLNVLDPKVFCTIMKWQVPQTTAYAASSVWRVCYSNTWISCQRLLWWLMDTECYIYNGDAGIGTNRFLLWSFHVGSNVELNCRVSWFMRSIFICFVAILSLVWW